MILIVIQLIKPFGLLNFLVNTFLVNTLSY